MRFYPLLALSGFQAAAFAPTTHNLQQPSTTLHLSKANGRIVAELQDLNGKSQHNPLDTPAAGFDEPKHNPISSLKREVWEKDKQLNKIEKKLEETLEGEAAALNVANVSLHELDQLHEQRSSIRSLLWHATKLAGQRIKNGAKYVLTLGRSRKAKRAAYLQKPEA